MATGLPAQPSRPPGSSLACRSGALGPGRSSRELSRSEGGSVSGLRSARPRRLVKTHATELVFAAVRAAPGTPDQPPTGLLTHRRPSRAGGATGFQGRWQTRRIRVVSKMF